MLLIVEAEATSGVEEKRQLRCIELSHILYSEPRYPHQHAQTTFGCTVGIRRVRCQTHEVSSPPSIEDLEGILKTSWANPQTIGDAAEG